MVRLALLFLVFFIPRVIMCGVGVSSKSTHRNQLGESPGLKAIDAAPSRPPAPTSVPPQSSGSNRRTIDTSQPLKNSTKATADKDNGKCSKKNSLDQLAKIPSFSSPQPVPDSGVYYISKISNRNSIAEGSGNEVKSELHYLSMPFNDHKLAAFDEDITTIKLSPDYKFIAIIKSKQKSGGESQSSSKNQISLYEIKTAKWTNLETKSEIVTGIVWASPTDLLYTAGSIEKNSFSLYQMSLSRKPLRKLLVTVSGFFEITDLSPDKSKALTLIVNSNSSVSVFDFNKKALRPLNMPEANYIGAKFTKDSKHVIAISDRFNNSRIERFSVDASSKPITLSDEQVEVDSFVLSSDLMAIAILENREAYSKITAFEVDSSGRKGSIIMTPDLVDSVVEGVSFHGAKNLIYVKSATRVASQVHMFKFPKDTLWLSASQELHEGCLAKERLIKTRSFGGVEISNFLYDSDDKKTPVIILVHDGLQSQFRPGFHPEIQYMWQHGFRVFAPNVRGSSGYGAAFMALANGEGRLHAVTDVISGAKWLVDTETARRGSIGIYGDGYGGFISLSALISSAGLISVGAQNIQISDLKSWIQKLDPSKSDYWSHRLGHIDNVALKELQQSHLVKNLKLPYLILSSNSPGEIQSDSVLAFRFPTQGMAWGALERARSVIYFMEPFLTKN